MMELQQNLNVWNELMLNLSNVVLLMKDRMKYLNLQNEKYFLILERNNDLNYVEELMEEL